jgi:hypothetical protein
MKKKIYILPDSPKETEVREILGSLVPQLNSRIAEQIVTSYGQIQARLRDASINQPSFHAHQTQSLSDGKHTITLVGRLDPPSGFQKFLDIFG